MTTTTSRVTESSSLGKSPLFLPCAKYIHLLLVIAGLRMVLTFRSSDPDASTRSVTITATNKTLRGRHRDQTTKWEIFQPYFDMPDIKQKPNLLGNPHAYIQNIQERLDWLDTITVVENIPEKTVNQTNLERARSIYLETLKNHLSAYVYGDLEKSVYPGVQQARANLGPLDNQQRENGFDWTYLGDTMVGYARLKNIKDLVKDVIDNNVTGDYIETGVWRGGASMFARSVLYAYGEEKNRKSYVCDSFQGLPPGDRGMHQRDAGWDRTGYLEVNEEIVAGGFQKYSLLDENVYFAKGFFNETMPHLAPQLGKLAVMRLDGDLYESTVDVLYHLYDKLSIGGYVIMDDWNGFPSKDACEDFFKVHNISPEVIQIDAISAYWQKTEEVDVQFWRYQQSKFTDSVIVK